MTETGGQFAGASQRGTKHNPRVDDELVHEMQGMLKSERQTHAEEWREVEPSAEGEPDVDTDPSGTMVGGTPAGMDAAAVEARSELARWLDRADFPSDGPSLAAAAREHHAPDVVVGELERLPTGETFSRVGDVVRALGYPTES